MAEEVLGVALKPRLRGVSHLVAAFFALAAGIVLVAVAPSRAAAVAAAIYGSALVAQLGTSAAYHRIEWSAGAAKRMRRLDHGMIFVLIAGTYTPFCLLALDAISGPRMLVVVWSLALLGIGKSIFWAHAPRLITAGAYLVCGWSIAPWTPQVIDALHGDYGFVLGGGVLYSLGALVYALKWPDPSPRVFGFHEVFHAFVVAANVCFFAAISRLVVA